ncbi:MAG: threonine/serine dehydratase [Proteobacteria bacterium]|nr:threonine/serine dehydratase [Pseudomonadota bacterium]
MVDVADIEAAAGRLNGVSVRTPLLQSFELDQVTRGKVLIKPECLQVTGSFKIRGAYNRLSQLTAQQARNGVVAWSSGNHAQGVAAAGAMLDINTIIVMPADAPKAKLANTRRLGGEVITYDRYTGDREAIARKIAAERGAAIVPSYDHEHIIAGQGTIGLELAEDAMRLGLPPDQVLIPCGGGGLSSGCSVALKSRLPEVSVYAVEPVEFDDTARSFASGERVRIDDSARSICDALQTPMPGELTFAINCDLLSDVLTVSDDEVRSAMRFAFRNLKLVVEPGGAVALAAVLSGKLDTAGKTTAIVLSGGNVDVDLFAEIQAEPK